MAEKPPLPHEEVQRILRRLEPLMAERCVILVGGQAVSFWMRMLQLYSDELASVEPVTSKDIDFEGGAQAVRRAGELLSAQVKIATIDDNTPNRSRPLHRLGRLPARDRLHRRPAGPQQPRRPRHRRPAPAPRRARRASDPPVG